MAATFIHKIHKDDRIYECKKQNINNLNEILLFIVLLKKNPEAINLFQHSV